MIQSRIAGGITTGWHHNGDRHVYRHVVEGNAVLEYGPEGEDAVDLNAGDFVYVPPHAIRRVVNPTTEDWVIVISFVGSGLPAVSVDGPSQKPSSRHTLLNIASISITHSVTSLDLVRNCLMDTGRECGTG